MMLIRARVEYLPLSYYQLADDDEASFCGCLASCLSGASQRGKEQTRSRPRIQAHGSFVIPIHLFAATTLWSSLRT